MRVISDAWLVTPVVIWSRRAPVTGVEAG